MTEYDLRNRSYEFSVRLIKFLNRIRAAKVSSPLINQLVRSGTSIGANIEEADSSPSRKDLKNKMFIAKKEAAETVYWLKIFCNAELMKNPENIAQARELFNECQQILKIISSIVRKI